ncbi:hypothetical protein FACS189459_4700 [Bacilli bacterium]|nr:hypothetical protein FACS189459_4700 [Bacilli bacterium]
MQLSKNNKIFYIEGFQFPLDCAPTRMIADDKSAQSELMKKNNIDCFQHYFFNPYELDINDIYKLFDIYKKIVIKQNNGGTGGKNIFLVTNKKQISLIIKMFVEREMFVSVSPYYSYEIEYRMIVLKGKIELCYEKHRPFIIGDGKTCIEKLTLKKYGKSLIIDSNINKNTILKKNEKIILIWTHNLKTGAEPVVINDQQTINKFKDQVSKITKLFNINFCSIDFAIINNIPHVVEINGGVMMEKFSSTSDKNYIISKNIYKKALSLVFGTKMK